MEVGYRIYRTEDVHPESRPGIDTEKYQYAIAVVFEDSDTYYRLMHGHMIDETRDRDVFEMALWFTENINDGFMIHREYFFITSEEDAVAFKLRWT